MATKKCPQCGNLNWERAAKCDCGYQYPRLQNTGTIKPAREGKKPRREIQTARDWYIWLWISPLFTIPTLLLLLTVFTYSGERELNEEQWIIAVVAVLGSGLWHLILLYPAIGGKTEFIRWHGRQALLLAGVRTAIFAFGLIVTFDGMYGFMAVFFFLILIAVWLFGTLWGQGQATHGDCSLMRWTGHGAELPRPLVLQAAPSECAKEIPGPQEVDRLLGIIRFNPDPEQRRAALAELDRLGMVESM